MFSHIIQNVSARALDVAEHSSILKNKVAIRILVIFQDRPMFSHIIQNVSARAFDAAEHSSILKSYQKKTH